MVERESRCASLLKQAMQSPSKSNFSPLYLLNYHILPHYFITAIILVALESNVVNVGSSPGCRFQRCLNPSVREGGVFTSKVNPAFTSEELSSII